MKIRFQAVNFTAAPPLIEFATKRAKKIELFHSQLIGVEITTKLSNSTDSENKLAELRCLIPGDDVIIKKKGKSFEEAIASASNAAQRTLKRRKNRERAV